MSRLDIVSDAVGIVWQRFVQRPENASSLTRKKCDGNDSSAPYRCHVSDNKSTASLTRLMLTAVASRALHARLLGSETGVTDRGTAHLFRLRHSLRDHMPLTPASQPFHISLPEHELSFLPAILFHLLVVLCDAVRGSCSCRHQDTHALTTTTATTTSTTAGRR